MCASLFSQMADSGCSQSVLHPTSLGKLWLQAADVDCGKAPKLVTKRTFLEFELKDKSPTLSRCSSDRDITYGSGGQPHFPRSSSSGDTQFKCCRSSQASCPEAAGSCSQGSVVNPQIGAGNGGQVYGNIFVAVPVFMPSTQPAVSSGIMHALIAKKAALSDTVAQLSLAALKAEAPVLAKSRTSAHTRRVKKSQSKRPSNTPSLASSHASSKDSSDSGVDSGASSEIAEQTTIMLRNLPLTYTRTMLLDLLDSEGFKGRYDFLYLPSNFETSLGFGYAFVNFSCEDDAELAFRHFRGFNTWTTPSEEVCETSWSDPYQGLAANVERYRNSPVMHESVDDRHKPVVFRGGIRQAFPAPTKLIKAPKTVHRSIPLSTAVRRSGA